MSKNSKSDRGRDVAAAIAAQNLKDIIECASPDTLNANKAQWENQIKGYEASKDSSLNEP